MSHIIVHDHIEKKILAIRGKEVILDRDLAVLYDVETRALKQAVRRNMDRFPPDFMFELTNEEIDELVSQSVIPSKKYFGGAKPYVFTEQGVAMLSAVLTSPIAVQMSVRIMKAFVNIRQYMKNNSDLFLQVSRLENRYIDFEMDTQNRFKKLFDAIEMKKLPPEQGIFFDGQIFDAWEFVSGLVRSAKKSIILIDNYIDEKVLTLFAKKMPDVSVSIYTSHLTDQLILDMERFNSQYSLLKIVEFRKAHDRFLIIDRDRIYHIGASLKDIGKKWFAFSLIKIKTSNFIKQLD